jgi:hypothetical protein
MKTYLDFDLIFDDEKDSIQTQLRNLCMYILEGERHPRNIQNALSLIEERIGWEKREGGNLKEEGVGMILTLLDSGLEIAAITTFLINERGINKN